MYVWIHQRQARRNTTPNFFINQINISTNPDPSPNPNSPPSLFLVMQAGYDVVVVMYDGPRTPTTPPHYP